MDCEDVILTYATLYINSLNEEQANKEAMLKAKK